jgi:hypothetical protein
MNSRRLGIFLFICFSITAIGLEVPMGVLVEIRAAEGGDDAKLLVEEQLKIYARLTSRRGL